METTFMTIHNLTPEANIMYASDSIVDILGYHPEEVTGRSCFDYFHPDEVPFARGVHNRGVRMDKAAVLHYARIRGRDGQWVGCECVFTIVHDVLVACTSVYRGEADHERRAVEAGKIRRLFASSPNDPRYHMLEHLSAKFRAPPQPSLSEPRAALILNRFTRTLTVMYATDAISEILGVAAAQFKEKSFYECIQQNCLPDAIRCLESAKANDSIAYLRFWYRDPRRPEDLAEEQAMQDASQSSDSDGGVEIDVDMGGNSNVTGEGSSSSEPCPSSRHSGQGSLGGEDRAVHSNSPPARPGNAHVSSGESTDLEHDSAAAMFDQPQGSRSSTGSANASSRNGQARGSRRATPAALAPVEPFEIEAVVSCTSDGLVVVLRRARPLMPDLQRPAAAAAPAQARPFANGFFAAPWGVNPVHPHVHQPNPHQPFAHGFDAPHVPAGEPPMDSFMASIREVAVFAWSLVGINGNIANYGHGVPHGEAQPPQGYPVWDPYAQPAPPYQPPVNQAAERWAQRDLQMSQGNNHDQKPPHQNIPGDMEHFQGYGLNHGGYFYQGPGSYESNGYQNHYAQHQNQNRNPGHQQYQNPNPPDYPGPGNYRY